MQNEQLEKLKSRHFPIAPEVDEQMSIGMTQVMRDFHEVITALEAAEQRIATMTESYNSIGKINAEQALEIRELKLELREIKNG